MTSCDLIGLGFQHFEVSAEELDCQFALYAADRLFHVVRDGLREIPVHAGKLAQLFVHGGDQIFFGLELPPPFGAGQQIDKELGVVEAAGVAAIVRTSHLADDLLDLGKTGEH